MGRKLGYNISIGTNSLQDIRGLRTGSDCLRGYYGSELDGLTQSAEKSMKGKFLAGYVEACA